MVKMIDQMNLGLARDVLWLHAHIPLELRREGWRVEFLDGQFVLSNLAKPDEMERLGSYASQSRLFAAVDKIGGDD